MKIIYRLTAGRASDLRFKPEGYVLAMDEVEIEGNVLPDIDALHTGPVVLTAVQKIAAEELRVPFKQRGLREWFLQSAIAAGYITNAILDPANPLDENSQPFASFPHMLKANILQERAVRALRAQI